MNMSKSAILLSILVTVFSMTLPLQAQAKEDVRDKELLRLLQSSARSTRSNAPDSFKLVFANTEYPKANCLLKITCNSHILSLNHDVFRGLINSNQILGSAAQEILGITTENLGDHLMIYTNLIQVTELKSSMGSGRGGRRTLNNNQNLSQIYTIQLALKQEDMNPDKAPKLLQVFCTLVREELGKMYELHEVRFRGELEQAVERRKQTQQKLMGIRNLQRDLLKQAGRADLQRDHILAERRNLDKKKQQLEMELIGLEARKEATHRQKALMKRKFQEAIENDSILQELHKNIALQEKTIEALNKDNPSENMSLTERLLKRKVQAAQQIEMLKKTLGGEKIDQWHNELADMAIETAQLEAQLKHTNELLANRRTDELMELANRYYIEVRSRIDAVNETYLRAGEQVDAIEQQIQFSQPPEVVVIGG